MTTFVLVHGGWHGAWCWELLAAELTSRGHRAIAMDLPTEDPTAGAERYAEVVGTSLPTPALLPQVEHSDSASPGGAETALRRQVEQSGSASLGGAETGLLREGEQGRTRGGSGVVLVAHSLGGLTAPLVAAAYPVERMVLVAAMLPEPGRSVAERARAGERQTRRGLGAGQTVHGDGSSEWLPDAAVEWLYPDSPPERARAAAGRLRRQHWTVTTEPSPLTAWPDVPTTYVLCTRDRVIDDAWAREAVPRLTGTEPVELTGDHSPFLSRPGELADLLT